jgi:hypothetical protein
MASKCFPRRSPRIVLVAGGVLAVVNFAAAQDQKIQISGASYGYAGERKDVKDDVAKLCDGKPSCKFTVVNDAFTSKPPVDPSPGNDKGLMVFWSCGDAKHKTQFAEGRNAIVDCQ